MKKIKIKHVLLVFTFVLMLVIVGVGAYKIMNYVDVQNRRIEYLEGHVKLLMEEKNIEKDSSQFKENCLRGGTFNYLAIGNSITVHPKCDYWWNENGMAASKIDTDYYHIVVDFLKKNVNVNSIPYNFSVWESLDTDRAETLELLDSFLNSNIDLITVQLGENAVNLETWESDFKYLLQYICQKSPKAKLIVIGDFWTNDNRDEVKIKICKELNIIYLSLDEIKGKDEYICGLGTSIWGDDGTKHIVEHKGVAKHPNDAAMQYIASGIIRNLKFENGELE